MFEAEEVSITKLVGSLRDQFVMQPCRFLKQGQDGIVLRQSQSLRQALQCIAPRSQLQVAEPNPQMQPRLKRFLSPCRSCSRFQPVAQIAPDLQTAHRKDRLFWR